MSALRDLPVLAYDAGDGIRIESVPSRAGTVRWRVIDELRNCMSREGSWAWEPSPSNRTDEWLAQHRFPTASEAYAALRRSRGETPPAPAADDHEALSDRVAAQGVRDLLDGKLTGPPLPGTLAERVADAMRSD